MLAALDADSSPPEALLEHDHPSLLDVLKSELAWVKESRQARLSEQPRLPAEKNLVGLSFSGGGIRSATFNLGVLQGLAQNHLLHKIDYLSTVSGGGYIGSWLMAWMFHQDCGSRSVEQKLRQAPASARQNAELGEIRFLRNYSNYLTPRTGVFSGDFWTLVAVYLRNTFLNLLSLSFLFLALLLFPRAIVFLFSLMEAIENWTRTFSTQPLPAQWIAAALGLLFAGLATVFIGINISWLEPPPEYGPSYTKDFWFSRPAYVYWLIILPLIFAAACLSYAGSFIFAYFPPDWQSSSFAPLVSFLISSTNWFLAKFGLEWRNSFFAPLLGFAILFGQWLLATLVRWGILVWNSIRGKAIPTDGPSPIQILIGAAVAGTLSGMLFIPFSSFLTLGQATPGDAGSKWEVLTFAPPALIGIMLIAGTLHIGFLGRDMRDSHREWWARLGAYLFLIAIAWLALFWVAIDFPPKLSNFLSSTDSIYGHTLSAGGILFWLLSTAYGVLFGKSPATSHWIDDLPFKKKIPQYLAIVTPYIFILGLFLAFSILAASLDNFFLEYGWGFEKPPDDGNFNGLSSLLFLLCIAAAALFSLRIDINQFSMHNLYRNRLVRCFLGASVVNRINQPWTGFSKLDDFSLGDLKSCNSHVAPQPDGRPFPIFNTCLNVVRGSELALQMRKARSFILTPIYSGFTFPGLCGAELKPAFAFTTEAGPRLKDQFGRSTLQALDRYAGRRPSALPNERSGLTIGTAMAISGAAASPNMGHYSDPGLGFLMAVFDVRLGWWMGNPQNGKAWKHGSPYLGLRWMIYELLGLTTDTRPYVYLSDGGHFENLGIYELVRRRCRLIIACDASQDPAYACPDLRAAIERCRVDFATEIEMDLTHFRPESGLPQHFAVGKIHYPRITNSDGEASSLEGILILLKPIVVPGDPLDVANYSKTNPNFPHDSTVNQWYDEAHFENYRALGQATAAAASSSIEDTMVGIFG